MSRSAGFLAIFLPRWELKDLKGGRGGRWETHTKYGHPNGQIKHTLLHAVTTAYPLNTLHIYVCGLISLK